MSSRMRGRTARLATAAGLALLVLAGVSPSSAASLGGLTTDALGAATATTRSLTGVTVEWNPGAVGLSALGVTAAHLTADEGETFTAGDVIVATVDDGAAGRCDASAVVSSSGPVADLEFSGCALAVAHLRHVAVAVTGPGASSVLSGDLGGMSGTLSGFVGGVVDPSDRLAAGIESRPHEGVDTLTELYVDVHDATVDDLVGRRLIVSLYGSSTGSPPTHVYAGVVGIADDNEGIWAQVDPEGTGVDDFPTITADIRRLDPDGDWPAVSAIARYELVLLQTQHLASPDRTAGAHAYAVRALAGAVQHHGPADGTQPVDLDGRLTFSEPGGPVTTTSSLSFCHSFQVTNTSAEVVEWAVTFDTTKPPLWGIDPRIIDPNTSGGALTSIWNARTTGFDESTGLWTLGGDTDVDRTLDPGESVYAGYCARANIPPADPATFDTPQITLDPQSSIYYVALRVQVTSGSRWYVPWEVEIDLADYVCADVLPSSLAPENATLTPISGTRYLLRGTVSADTRFVSATTPRDFTFLRLSPGGHHYLPGTCG